MVDRHKAKLPVLEGREGQETSAVDGRKRQGPEVQSPLSPQIQATRLQLQPRSPANFHVFYIEYILVTGRKHISAFKSSALISA